MNSQNCRKRHQVKDTDTLAPKGPAVGNERVVAPSSRTIKLPAERELLPSALCLQRGTWQACKSPVYRKTDREGC